MRLSLLALLLAACGGQATDKGEPSDSADSGDPSDTGDTADSGDSADSGDPDADTDADGFTPADGDCDDADPSVHPGAADAATDGTDQDCDGVDGPDADADGHPDAATGGDDCDDTDPDTHPGASEVWNDLVDQDCDGVADAQGASCLADFTLEVADGTVVAIDGCTAWWLLGGFDFDPDSGVTPSTLLLTFDGVTGHGQDCSITVGQGGVCDTGYADFRDTGTSAVSIVTSDCPGVSDRYEGVFGSVDGYLRLDVLEVGALEPGDAGVPVEQRYAGQIVARVGSSLTLSGSFDVSLTAPALDVDSDVGCVLTDGDADGDGWVDPYFDGEDCDDSDRSTFPGAAPLDSATACMTDVDFDDYGAAAPAAGVTAGADCDDGEGDVHPGAADGSWDFGVDDDCDGTATPTAATAISAGWTEACALVDGAIRCYGAWTESGWVVRWEEGESWTDWVVNPPSGTFTSVVSSNHFVCGISAAGLPDCGGWDSDGVTTDEPSAGTWTSVAPGWEHACALGSGGALACWGNDDFGQVADTPVGTFASVVSSGWTSCALDASGAPTCWGDDGYGQVSTAPAGPLTSVALSWSTGCGLGADGTVSCWGDDSVGIVSNAPTGKYSQLSLGSASACALDAGGELSCWGDEGSGEVSDAPTGTFTQVGVGGAYACAIAAGGTIFCWGSDADGAVSGAPAGTWVELSTSISLACARGAAGEVACWGVDDFAP